MSQSGTKFCPTASTSITTFRDLSRNPSAACIGGSSLQRLTLGCSERFKTATGGLPVVHYVLLICLLVITNLMSTIPVTAQNPTATLSGTVMDQNGAVIPGVRITVISIAQGFQREVTADDEGGFVVSFLPPGNYTVKTERDGFAPAEIRDVILNVNDRVRLSIQLKIGSIGQTVDVTENASLINDSMAVGTLVDRQFVENLPLNGRSFQSLFELTNGLVLTKTGSEKGQFSVNGQRGNANYFTVDGVSANIGTSANTTLEQSGAGTLPGFSVSGGTNNLVSIDALQEFKIQTSTYAPEFGRTPGAQVSIVTRSGTNRFSGTLFEYFRNDALDANDWFANQKGLKRPPLRQNDFGVVVGGPVLLPSFGEGGRQPWYNGQNKTFFFFSYEGLRLRQPRVGISQVPSLSARLNAVPGIRPFLNAYPIPNGKDLGNNLAEFNASYSDSSSLNATSIRIDHAATRNLTIFARYNNAPSVANERGSFAFDSLNRVGRTQQNTQTLTAAATWAITQTVSNDLRANWSKTTGKTESELDNFGGAVPVADSLIFPAPYSRNNAQFFFIPSGVLLGALSVGKNASDTQRQINLIDNLSVVKETHALKFGIDYRRLTPILDISRFFFAPIFFNGITGALTGRADLISLSADAFPRFPIFTNFSAFAQDTWKTSPRLTLVYGLRWDVNPPPKEKNGNDPFTVTGLDSPATMALATRGTPLYKTTYNNIAPRLGMAYQLSQRQGRETMLRAGWGIFYDLGTTQAANAFSRFPYNATRSLFGVPFPADPAVITPPIPTLTPPFGDINVSKPNLKLPRTYQWNLTIEQSLGSNQTITSSYVGAAGRRLTRLELLVNPNQSFTRVFVTSNTATSDYHSMQLQFQRRMSRGIQALASYSWSHSIDIASSDNLPNLPNFRVDPRQDRGSSDFDIRHSFSAAITYNPWTPSLGPITGALFRNWSLDAIYRARSAAPVNIVTGQSLFGLSSPPVGRPNLILGVPLYLKDPSVGGGKRINPAAFSLPAAGQQGSFGRNSLRGFPVSQLDLALRREFTLREQVKVQLKAEFFNIFNHPNFGDPGFGFSNTNALNNSSFGRSTVMYGRGLGSGGLDGGFNPLYQIGGPRSTQLSLRLLF